jgi:hypothetical protein
MALSVSVLPEPDAPNSTVTPGGASNSTSSVKPPAAISFRILTVSINTFSPRPSGGW